MEIMKILGQDALTFKVKGRLDTNSAPELEKEITESIIGITKLIIDFAELQYISSAGLRVLLATQKTMNKQGTMVLKNVSDTIMEILEVTCFSEILTIE